MTHPSLNSTLKKYNIPQVPYADYFLSILLSHDSQLPDKRAELKEVIQGLLEEPGDGAEVEKVVDEVIDAPSSFCNPMYSHESDSHSYPSSSQQEWEYDSSYVRLDDDNDLTAESVEQNFADLSVGSHHSDNGHNGVEGVNGERYEDGLDEEDYDEEEEEEELWEGDEFFFGGRKVKLVEEGLPPPSSNPTEPNSEEYYDDTMTPLQLLQKIFVEKGLGEEELTGILEEVGWELGRAVDVIMDLPMSGGDRSGERDTGEVGEGWPALGSGSGGAVVVEAQQQSPPMPICRHYLAGGCFRSDCKYTHDTDSRLCKFWARGFCIKGDACEFVHSVTPPPVRSSPPKPPVPHTLPSPAPSKQSPPQPTLEDFPSLSKPTSTPSKFQINFLSPSTPFSTIANRAKSKPSPKPTPPPPSTPKHSYPSAPDTTKTMSWLTTGDTVTSIYEKERKSATEIGRDRAILIQRATQAYISGHKKLAKQLSLQAQELTEELNTLHSTASARIFSIRNTKTLQDCKVIDLHGLHPSEAIHHLEVTLSKWRKEGYRGE
ncbi:hypothetical protein HK097_010201, partial [Rhizophlyctis rosea]